MINQFLENVQKFPQKICFIYQEKGKIIRKNYQEVYSDTLRMINFLSKNEVNEKRKLLIFLKPSYLFYILMLASLMSSFQVIVIEDFKSKEKLEKMLELAKPDYLIVNNTTNIIKKFLKPLRKITTLNIASFNKNEEIIDFKYRESNEIVLVTFTSGGTGNPKKITRKMSDLESQFQMVSATIDFAEDTIILALLPIYVLANIIFGVTTLLYNKKNYRKLVKIIKKVNCNAVSASVSKFLKFINPLPEIKYCYTGGSLISLQDAKQIKKTFNNAKFTYIYGASEAVMISKTNLDNYLKYLENQEIIIGEKVKGLEVKIVNDLNGIGEIAVKGLAVLVDDYHLTGDLGYLKDNKVYLVGRKNFSSLNSDGPLYNYLIEMKVAKDYPHLKKVVFINYLERPYLIIEGKGKIDQKKYPYELINVHKIPRDIRHQYKVDYLELIKIIERKSK